MRRLLVGFALLAAGALILLLDRGGTARWSVRLPHDPTRHDFRIVDGLLVGSLSYDAKKEHWTGPVEVRSLRDGQVIHRLWEQGEQFLTRTISSDGLWAGGIQGKAKGKPVVFVWADLAGGTTGEVPLAPGRHQPPDLSPEGLLITQATPDEKPAATRELRIYDLRAGGKEVGRFNCLWQFRVSEGGGFLALTEAAEPHSLILWDTARRAVAGRLEGGEDFKGWFARSKDGRTLLAGGLGGHHALWRVTEPARPELLGRIPTNGHRFASGSADWSVLLFEPSAPDQDGTLRVVDGRTAQPLGEYPAPKCAHRSHKLSGDGRWLLQESRGADPNSQSTFVLFDLVNQRMAWERTGGRLLGNVVPTSGILAFRSKENTIHFLRTDDGAETSASLPPGELRWSPHDEDNPTEDGRLWVRWDLADGPEPSPWSKILPEFFSSERIASTRVFALDPWSGKPTFEAGVEGTFAFRPVPDGSAVVLYHQAKSEWGMSLIDARPMSRWFFLTTLSVMLAGLVLIILRLFRRRPFPPPPIRPIVGAAPDALTAPASPVQ